MAVRNSSPGTRQTRLRHLWLASLGAAAVARREVRGAVASIRDGVEAVGKRFKGRIARTAKPAPRKSPVRGATRKAAAQKKPTPRPGSARTRAERRVASKGR